MNKYRQILIISLIVSIISCGSNAQDGKKVPKKNVEKRIICNNIPHTVSIYRFGEFPKEKAQKLEMQLKEFFPHVVLKEESLILPAKHYNKERNRYRGTGLLEELSMHRNGDAVLGLTDYVIFKPNEISQTYGVMGISPVGTYKCVVSSKTSAGGKEQSNDNFIKLSLHELGHAFGLNHCADQHCYMVDAEHKMKFPQTTGFCESCKAKLNAKSWTIK